MTAHTANEIFARTVRSERKITAQVLKMILDFDDHKYHIELGFSSLFEWLTKAHGYDEGSANRRIQSAKAMRAVPEVEQKLQDGKTTMTNLVKAQSIFRHVGQMSKEEKREVIESIEGQTTAEATKTLFKMFPEAALKINQDRRMVVDEEHVRYAYNLSQDQEEIVTRAKELLSHKIPNGSMAEVITYLAAYFVERNDPLLEKPSVRCQVRPNTKNNRTEKSVQLDAATNDSNSSNSVPLNDKQSKSDQLKLDQSKLTDVASKRRVTIKERNEVIRAAGGRCEYVDLVTGRRCDNRVRVEADHIRMRVFGGTNNRENLRCLCRVHNQFMSEKNLGKAWANCWRG
jgi:hypothetical protein